MLSELELYKMQAQELLETVQDQLIEIDRLENVINSLIQKPGPVEVWDLVDPQDDPEC